MFGIVLGGDYLVIPLMTAEIFGVRNLGRLLGMILTSGGVAEALSPWMMGRMRDATGSYTQSCLLLGVALLGAVAVVGLPEWRKST